MARQKFWVGSTGPFYYDDATAVPDSRGAPAVTENQAAIVTPGTIVALTAPVQAGQVMRFEDMGSALPTVYQPNLVGNSYSVGATDFCILVDDDDADVTGTVVVGLPAAASSLNRWLHIKKIGSSFTVQIDPNGAETIDDAATFDMATQYDCISIICDGTSWWIF